VWRLIQARYGFLVIGVRTVAYGFTDIGAAGIIIKTADVIPFTEYSRISDREEKTVPLRACG